MAKLGRGSQFINLLYTNPVVILLHELSTLFLACALVITVITRNWSCFELYWIIHTFNQILNVISIHTLHQIESIVFSATSTRPLWSFSLMLRNTGLFGLMSGWSWFKVIRSINIIQSLLGCISIGLNYWFWNWLGLTLRL